MSIRVAIGFHSWGMVNARFCSSLVRALGYEGRKVSEVIDMPSPYVAEARNRVVQTWLDHSKAKYLLMVDGDMEFPEDAVSTMAWLAEIHQFKVLGANYSLADAGNSLFAPAKKGDLVRPLIRVVPNRIYRNLGGAATGFLLIERGLAEQFRSPGGYDGPWHWFDHDREATAEALVMGDAKSEFLKCGFTKMGEDMSFCRRAARLGVEIAGTTHVPLVHHKLKPTVPVDQLEQFEGKRVYTDENPWLKRKSNESKIMALTKAGAKVSGQPSPKPEGEQTNEPEDEGVRGGGPGVRAPGGADGDRAEPGAGDPPRLEGPADPVPDVPGDLHPDPADPAADGERGQAEGVGREEREREVNTV